jgi:hypothetical protein
VSILHLRVDITFILKSSCTPPSMQVIFCNPPCCLVPQNSTTSIRPLRYDWVRERSRHRHRHLSPSWNSAITYNRRCHHPRTLLSPLAAALACSPPGHHPHLLAAKPSPPAVALTCPPLSHRLQLPPSPTHSLSGHRLHNGAGSLNPNHLQPSSEA